jgi:hypothetical protein
MAVPLEEFLDNQYDAQLAPAAEQRFEINDADKADWAVRKIRRYQKNIDEAKITAQTQIERINQWLASVSEENQKQIDFFKGMLAPYAMTQLAGQKKRSLKLPSGTIGLRSLPVQFEKDDDVLLEWVKANLPGYVAVKESVVWGELKKTVTVVDGKVLTEDGEIIPGVTATEPSDVFYVKGDE